MNKKHALISVGILVVLGWAMVQGTGGIKRGRMLPAPTGTVKISVSPTSDPVGMTAVYTNEKMGYEIGYPEGWEVTVNPEDENFDDRVVFLPAEGKYRGNIVEISVTVVTNNDRELALSTLNEWNRWLEEPKGATDSTGVVTKEGEKMVEGVRSVVLRQDKELPDGYNWSVMTWVRKGDTNIYIATLGAGRYTGYEAQVVDWVAGSLKTR